MEGYADLVAVLKIVPNISTKIILMSTTASKFSVRKWKILFCCSQRLVQEAKSLSYNGVEKLQKIMHLDPRTRQWLGMNKMNSSSILYLQQYLS